MATIAPKVSDHPSPNHNPGTHLNHLPGPGISVAVAVAVHPRNMITTTPPLSHPNRPNHNKVSGVRRPAIIIQHLLDHNKAMGHLLSWKRRSQNHSKIMVHLPLGIQALNRDTAHRPPQLQNLNKVTARRHRHHSNRPLSQGTIPPREIRPLKPATVPQPHNKAVQLSGVHLLLGVHLPRGDIYLLPPKKPIPPNPNKITDPPPSNHVTNHNPATVIAPPPPPSLVATQVTEGDKPTAPQVSIRPPRSVVAVGRPIVPLMTPKRIENSS